MPNGVMTSIVRHLSQRLYVQTLAIAKVFSNDNEIRVTYMQITLIKTKVIVVSRFVSSVLMISRRRN